MQLNTIWLNKADNKWGKIPTIITIYPITIMSFNSSDKNATQIAKEVLQLLAAKHIAPTPEAYVEYYEKISKERIAHPLEDSVIDFADAISKESLALARLGKSLADAIIHHDWIRTGSILSSIAETIPTLEHSDKKEPFLSNKSTKFTSREDILRDMLGRLLSYSLLTLLKDAPELANETHLLKTELDNALSDSELSSVQKNVNALSFKIELHNNDIQKKQQLLQQLFQLLLENIDSLLEKESWLSQQINSVQDLLSAPVTQVSLKEATYSLKNMIYKQGILKSTLEEERLAVKNMMVAFVERLSTLVSTTDSYHKAITTFSKKVAVAENIGDLSSALNSIMEVTKKTQQEAYETHKNLLNSQNQLIQAQTKISALENQLSEMNNLVQEDYLTGSFNRRGMDAALEREMHRSIRNKSALCVALLDLDDFKQINDHYGHDTGDEVLIHLVNTIKDTLRKLDVIARFGGEEFLVILPDTDKFEAAQIVTRIQRELSKSIFMYNNSNIFITFSAGVAQYVHEETQENMIKRADCALYKAKNEGKNRVVIADEVMTANLS